MVQVITTDGRMRSIGQTTSPHDSPEEQPPANHVKNIDRGFSLSSRVQSFRYAWRGVKIMLRSQQNAWIHAVASVCVLTAGGLFGLDAEHWCWLVLAIMAVWTAEAVNTALELLADVASPEFHPLVEKAKDVAAGAVLISAMGSVLIGLLVLGPPLWKFVVSLLQ